MRSVAGIVVFVGTLVLGTFFAWSLRDVDEVLPGGALSVVEAASDTAPSPTGIRIAYAGSAGGEYGPYLEFMVYNGLPHPVSYIGYEQYSPVRTSINGVLEQAWECTNGMPDFTIEPGRTTILRVGRYDFRTRPRKSDQIAIEFLLGQIPQGEAEHYLSEPFHLPEDFRKSIGIH